MGNGTAYVDAGELIRSWIVHNDFSAPGGFVSHCRDSRMPV